MADNPAFEAARQVHARHAEALLRWPNVVGVAVGYRRRGGELTDEPALVVMVDHKIGEAELDIDAILPKMIDGVAVDVQDMGGKFEADQADDGGGFTAGG
ncbi:MAG: hypothetical protein EA396_01650 [Anaerolineaceae bacterium]|nr:MAG: hypothetical protein EA396_01650 [Anaerolineaceae bacterium]